MPATARLTRIENMPQERREFIESLLRRRPRPSGPKIAALYNAAYPPAATGEDDLDASTIYSHLHLRLKEEREAIQEQKQEYVAKIQAISETGLDEATQALIWEKLQEGNVTSAQLILLRSVETQRKKLALDLEKLQIDKQNAETRAKDAESRAKDADTRARESERKAKEAESKVEKVKEAIAGAGSPDKPFDEKEVLRKISAVIGVGGQPEERIEPIQANEA